MSAWITDRLPTHHDGDKYGQVYITTSVGDVRPCFWENIGSRPWQPITYPEPYVKPKVWTVRKSYSGRGYLEKNGTHVIGLSPFKEIEQTAIEKALNDLEEQP